MSNREAKVTRKKKVIFHPQDSGHAVTVRFCERVPFSDWQCTVKTGSVGKPLEGKVRSDAMDEYPYAVFSNPIPKPGLSARSEQGQDAHPLATPKLIVSPGGDGLVSSDAARRIKR